MPPSAQVIVWTSEFDTGVPEIDEQHRILVHTLNEAAIKLGHDGRRERLEQITQDLLAYALYHFETEEDLMRQYGYPELAATDAEVHEQQHRAFSAKVLAVREGLKSDSPINARDLVSFLNDWLLHHIMNTDKKLGSFIVEARAAGAQRSG